MPYENKKYSKLNLILITPSDPLDVLAGNYMLEWYSQLGAFLP